MKVQLLEEKEIAEASQLAQRTFGQCLDMHIPQREYVSGFYQSTTEQALTEEWRAGKLHLWGIRENNYLVAMSAMRPDGYITMLYVNPAHQRSGMGKKLLHVMRVFAEDRYHLRWVFLNALPAAITPYFLGWGFLQSRNVFYDSLGRAVYTPLYAPSIKEVHYSKRSLSPAAWIIVLGGFLGAIVSLAFLFMFFYILRS